MTKKILWTNVITTVLIMGLFTLAAQFFFHYSRNSTSVAIIYVLAVMLVARYSIGYVPGIVASVFGVFFVNYVYTYPYMHFNLSIDGYPVTFSGMLIVSVITSTLTTRFKQQSQLLNEQEKLLVEAEKETMRANLLRAVSHDLRTPLTGIIGLSKAYLDGRNTLSEKEKAEMVGSIQEDANWLLNMVENLLAVTRIRVGDAQVNTTPELLEEVVSEAVLRFKKRLPDVSVQVKVPEEYLLVPMDATLIEQVIINLLENAAYHSGSKEPIEFSVEKWPHEVAFFVRDSGRGIDPERLSTIFDGGGTDSNASGDSHKGMGIGLSICKTIINAHHGVIEARNRKQGAEFMFTLPLEEKKA